MEAAPGDSEILLNLGALYLELGRFSAARDALQRFLRHAKGPASAARGQQVEEILQSLDAN